MPPLFCHLSPAGGRAEKGGGGGKEGLDLSLIET